MDLQRLEDEVTALASVDVGTMSALELGVAVAGLRRVAAHLEVEIARFVHAAERADVWRDAGASSMPAWLAEATGSTLRTARSQVDLADALAVAPQVAEAMRDGFLSPDNARLLGAVVHHEAFGEHAQRLIDLASGSPRDTRRGLESWLTSIAPASTDAAAELADREFLRFTPGDHGLHDVSGKLTGASVAAVQAALSHLAGAAWDDETGRPPAKRVADALVELCRTYSAGEVRGGRERPKLLVTCDLDVLEGRAARRGRVVGSDATLSSEQIRALLCDADVHRVVTSGRSTVLDLGSATRLVSDSQYLALAARDGGCRWPGCDRPPQWCEAHHIDEVARDDGPTNLDNLVLMCSYHHHLVHQRRWSLHGDAHDLTIRGPGGRGRPAPPKGALVDPRPLRWSA
jgi:hypothetical protein